MVELLRISPYMLRLRKQLCDEITTSKAKCNKLIYFFVTLRMAEKVSAEVYEDVPYINFYLGGDWIFGCQKAWLPQKNDIYLKCQDLADIHEVSIKLIVWSETSLKLPIILPNELTIDLGISLSK